jgi:hypothetical protein
VTIQFGRIFVGAGCHVETAYKDLPILINTFTKREQEIFSSA